jgi:hypothetical protein
VAFDHDLWLSVDGLRGGIGMPLESGSKLREVFVEVNLCVVVAIEESEEFTRVDLGFVQRAIPISVCVFKLSAPVGVELLHSDSAVFVLSIRPQKR